MNRYLLTFSYIGTRFKTFAKNVRKGHEVDNSSVEGALEIALQTLKPANPIKLFTSSRTDAGVHALQSTVHVDLERRNGQLYDSEIATKLLNRFLIKAELDLIVYSMERVPRKFHAKSSSTSRTYLYRLAIVRSQRRLPKLDRQFPINFKNIPIEELDRCCFRIVEEFDMEKAKAVAPLLVGRHDFRTFMGTNNEDKTKEPSFAIRTINSIEIVPGKALTIHNSHPLPNDFEYWDIRINAKSFVYRQIRRIVGTLIAVAEGKTTERDVYEMLTIPSKHSWRSGIKVAPAYGLYLTQVVYPMDSKSFEIGDKLENEVE